MPCPSSTQPSRLQVTVLIRDAYSAIRSTSSRSIPNLKGVKHLREVPAVPRLAQTVQQRALQVSDPDPRVVNPDSPGAKESLRAHLYESVGDPSYATAPPGMAGIAASIPRNQSLSGRENEHRPGYLLGQSVVMHRRPVRDRGRVHNGHRYLEFMCVMDSRCRGGKRIEAAAQWNYPPVPLQVM